MDEWMPAYQVAEVATVAILAQQGNMPIPPPPLAMIAVQAEFEHRVASFDDGRKDVEPEPPPPPVHQYSTIAAAVPPHIMRAAQAAAQPVVPPAPAPAPAPQVVAPAPLPQTPAPLEETPTAQVPSVALEPDDDEA